VLFTGPVRDAIQVAIVVPYQASKGASFVCWVSVEPVKHGLPASRIQAVHYAAAQAASEIAIEIAAGSRHSIEIACRVADKPGWPEAIFRIFKSMENVED